MSGFNRFLKFSVCIGLIVAFTGCASARKKDKEGPNKDETVGRYMDQQSNTNKVTTAISKD